MFEPQMSAQERMAYIDKQVEDAQRAAQAAEQMRYQVETLRATAMSSAKTVKVVLDSSGRLQNIEFTDAADRASRQQLANDVKEACALAMAEVRKQVETFAHAAFGEGSDLSERVMQAYNQTHREPEPTQASPYASTPNAAPAQSPRAPQRPIFGMPPF